MTGHTVEKIGGTSIARTDAVVDNVLIGGRSGKDLYNRIFVVSAYAGITDRLLENKKTGKAGVYGEFAGSDSDWAWGDALTEVRGEMLRINEEIFGQQVERTAADGFILDRIEGARSMLMDLQRLCSFGHFDLREHLMTVREMLSALGEVHSANNTALLLRCRGVNSVFVDLTGWRDETQPSLEDRIDRSLSAVDLAHELPICTGFAQCHDGLLDRYGRGYTEVTFSQIAALTEAREAIIHKEFHLSSADPEVVGIDRVRTIGQTNYDVADQLSNLGMEAVHPHAAKVLRQAGIPLRVRNTFEPQDAGTIIRSDYVSERPRAEIVTGIKNVIALEVFEQDMVRVKGYDMRILKAIGSRSLRIVTKCSNANTIMHYVTGSLARVRKAISDIQKEFPGAEVGMKKVAIVSVIGSALDLPDLLENSIGALHRADVPVLGLHRLPGRVDVMFIIDESHFDASIRALHEALIEQEAAAPTP